MTNEIPTSVVVLNRDGAEPMLIRSGPSDAEVREFAAEHNRRHGAGEPGGYNQSDPSRPVPAQLIVSAHRFEDEPSWLDDPQGGEELELSPELDVEPDDEDVVDEEE